MSARHHVVAQVIEAELRIRPIGDVGRIGRLLRLASHAVLDEADFHAHEAVDSTHPFAVAPGQVIVDGDYVDVVARQCVQIARERRDERFTFARLHLGDVPVVQRHAADELHVEMAQSESAEAGFAHGGESLGQKRVERLATVEALTVFDGQMGELLVG